MSPLPAATIGFVGCTPVAFERRAGPAGMPDQLIAADDRVYTGLDIISAQNFLGPLEVIHRGHALGTRCPDGIALHLVEYFDHSRSRPKLRNGRLLARAQLAPFSRLHCLPSS